MATNFVTLFFTRSLKSRKRSLFLLTVTVISFFLLFTCAKNPVAKYLLEGHSATVNALAYSPDGKNLVTASQDKSVLLWDIEAKKIIRTFTGHEYSVNDVAFSHDGTMIASVGYYLSSENSQLIIWEIATGKEILNTKKGTASFARVAFSPDDKRILTTGVKDENGYHYPITILSVSGGELILSTIGEDKSILALSYSQDGRYFFATDFARNLYMFDAESGQMKYSIMAHSGYPAGLALSQDGKFIVTGCGSFAYGELPSYPIVIRDLATGYPVKELKGDGNPLNCVVISPDGKYIASGGGKKVITLWEVESGKAIAKYKGNSGSIASLQFSPDGKYLASSAILDKSVKIWELPAEK